MRVSTQMALLLLFSIPTFAQSKLPPPTVIVQLDEIRKRPCDIQVPEGFSCAVLFIVGMPAPDEMIDGTVGEDVSQVSVYLDGKLHTIVYDPPLKRDYKFSHLRRGMHIPVRIERDDLILQWPDQTRSKGKIIRREAIFPNQPQPA